MFKHNSIPITL